MKTTLECREVFSKYDKIYTVSDLQAGSDNPKTPEVLFVRYREDDYFSPEEWAKSQPDTIERHGHIYKKTDKLFERSHSNRKLVKVTCCYTKEIVETFIEYAVRYIIVN